MKKIAILYHSGVGNTKKVSEMLYNELSKTFTVELHSVENLPTNFNLNDFDGIAIGFPVIHTHPTKRILNFVHSIQKLSVPKATYLFTTCVLYSANTLRIFAKHCIPKGIVPVLDRVFTACPASDGALIAPFIKSFFIFPKNIDDMIKKDATVFASMIDSGECRLKMPRFRIGSIINYPNKLIGHLITLQIYTHKNRCTQCGKCICNCPANALERDSFGYPSFISKKCEKCYRCIHSCPQLALSLSKRNPPRKVLSQNITGI